MGKEISWAFLLIFAIGLMLIGPLKTTTAQCTVNGCTSCTRLELVCDGLGIAPQSQLQNLGTNIERISLTNGAISEIPDGFFSLTNLKSIDLSNNQLTSLNMESLEYSTSLRTIDLTGNPIVCDSNIDWLKKWTNFYPLNEVMGTCTNGVDLNTYLSDKPGNLVRIKFAAKTLEFDRSCMEISLQFVIYGKFTSDLTYRAVVSGSAILTVANEEVTVPVGTNSSTFTITVTNRGEDRSNVIALLFINSKYPVSYGTQVEILLGFAPNVGCAAPIPVNVATTPTVATTLNTDVVTTGSPPRETEIYTLYALTTEETAVTTTV